jgi:hypothetical protein
MVFKCSRILERSIVEQKHVALKHERSSVGARPSSAAPVEQYPGGSQTEQSPNLTDAELLLVGAAEDGRAPTEERSYVWDDDFCSTGAAEDGRAPTEERSCVREVTSVRCVGVSMQKFLVH